MYKKLIAAHRGASAYTHQNTLEAFSLALDMCADMIEFDIRLTSDNIPVVFHDADIENIPVASLTYERLRQISDSLGFSIPTFKETVKMFGGKIAFDVELKEKGYERRILSAMKDVDFSMYIVTSFYRDMICGIRSINENVVTGMLFSENESQELKSYLGQGLRLSRETDYLCLHWQLVDDEVLRISPVPIIVWTVDDTALMNRLLIADKVAGIITNTPDVAVAIRNRISDSNIQG